MTGGTDGPTGTGPSRPETPAASPARRSGIAAGRRVQRDRRLGKGRILVLAGVSVLVIALAAWAISTRMRTTAPPPTASAPPALTAHGVVQPVARASIATLNGGVINQLLVRSGQAVESKQPVARVTLPGQTEILVAPWRGTVMGTNVQHGDTVLPGTTVVTIGDLSGYQVETTDVDEYLIGRIRPDQPVIMTVEALEQGRIRGFVKSVSLQQQQSPAGDHYPVVIALESFNPNLRPGMTVRITFLEETP